MKAAFIGVVTILLAGCGKEQPRPAIIIHGTVVNCWSDRAQQAAIMDLLTTDNELRHLDVSYESMPGCPVFEKGGTWEIHAHYADKSGNTVVIDWMRREHD